MPSPKKQLLLGGNISIAGGIEKAFARAQEIGSTCMQIFTKSNRQWNARPLAQDVITRFDNARQQSPVQTIVAHASYLINIGSPNKQLQKLSLESLMLELARVQELEIPYLVLHPGVAQQSPPSQDCLKQIAAHLDTALTTIKGKSMILLENMAGQGSSVGDTFEQLAFIYKHCKQKKRLGFCFDTCHAFAVGYDFTTAASYKQMWHNFDHIIGLQHLKAIHLNDSKKELGSRVDRHEFIGKGKIPLTAFALLINDEKLVHIPKILETPIDTHTDYVHDFKTLLPLLTKKHSSWVKGLSLETYTKG